MPKYTEKIETRTLPVIALRGIVAFPSVPLSFEIADDASIHAAEAAFENDALVLICSMIRLDESEAKPENLFRVGTVSKIKQSVKGANGTLRVITEGFSRAMVNEFRTFADYISADVICKTLTLTDEDSIKGEAYCRAMLTETR